MTTYAFPCDTLSVARESEKVLDFQFGYLAYLLYYREDI